MIVDLQGWEMDMIAGHIAHQRMHLTTSIHFERSLDDDPAYSERVIDEKSRQVADLDNLLRKLGQEVINVWDKNDWGCVCGNRQDTVGFYACMPDGEACEPDMQWAGHYWCAACGRVIDSITSLVILGESAERVATNTGFELALVDAKRPERRELDDAPVSV